MARKTTTIDKVAMDTKLEEHYERLTTNLEQATDGEGEEALTAAARAIVDAVLILVKRVDNIGFVLRNPNYRNNGGGGRRGSEVDF